METSDEYKRYQEARKHVQEIKGFYAHLASFILVMIVITFVNLKFTPEHLWFFYPLLGWGIGLTFHGLGVFGTGNIFNKNWEERKIQQFMKEEEEKLKENNHLK